jgi:mono/diheme cytochrome c family protein
MKRLMISAILILSGSVLFAADAPDTGGATYEAQKATALANPYANDLGPASIDVSSYPQELQDTYKNIFLVKCQRCHTASRPLNSQFVEPSGPKDQHQAKIDQWKKSNPEMFQDKLVWQIEGWTPSHPGAWDRYVHKMMAKPGCNIAPADGKKIWQFLTYDSEKRKTGANAAAWAEHRRKLLADFKAKNPARYRELYEVQ